jgi:hypothetical protein
VGEVRIGPTGFGVIVTFLWAAVLLAIIASIVWLLT